MTCEINIHVRHLARLEIPLIAKIIIKMNFILAVLLSLLPNRISKALSAKNQARILELALLIVAELGELTQIPEAEHKKLAKLGDKNIILYDLLKIVLDKYPEFINDDLHVSEVTKDREYYRDLETAKLNIQKTVINVIEHEQAIVGAEYRNAIAIFEDNVAVKVARRSEKAILVQDELNKAYKEYDKIIATMQDAAPAKKSKTDENGK